MRVLLAEFRQESNTFSPVDSDMAFWRESGWVLGADELREHHDGNRTALGGMLSVLQESSGVDVEVFFGPGFYAQSGGPVTIDVVDEYVRQLTDALSDAGDLDAVLLSLHGALQSRSIDDVDGYVVERVRALVGDRCVIGVSTDLHGHITEDLVRAADVVCGYQTYPHVDIVETGMRAARLVLQVASGIEIERAFVSVPMMISAAAYTTGDGSFGELIARAQRLVTEGRLIDFSVYQMQPWLDVEAPNSAVVVYASAADDAAAAAASLAESLYSMRHELHADLSSIAEIATRASSDDATRPIILVDSADSSNAGAPGDSAAVLDELIREFPSVRAATVVADPAAVEAAFAAGVGASLRLRIGGGIDPRAGSVETDAYVRSLHDGDFDAEGQGSAGRRIHLGRSAVVRVGNVDVLLCQHVSGNGDPQLYKAFGIDPLMYDLVVVKANTSFRAGYAALAGEIYIADTPGAAAPDIRRLDFSRSNLRVYPWVDDVPFVPEVVLSAIAR